MSKDEIKGQTDASRPGTLARAFAVGAGLGVVVVVAGAWLFWWSSRPRAWDDSAIRASVSALSNELDESGAIEVVVFRLKLTNDTDDDYRVEEPGRLTVMLRQGDVLRLAKAAVMELPVRIPPRESVDVALTVPASDLLDAPSKNVVRFHLDDIDPAPPKGTPIPASPKNELKTVHQETAAFLANSLNGIVILDEALRYRIELSEQWASEAP